MNAPQRLTPIALAAQEQSSELQRLLQGDYSPRYMLEGDSMDKMMRLAEQMATSKLSVPEYLRGNIGDCLAIVTQAMLWNMNPFAVAQKTHIVSGRLGYEAQLVHAVLQNSGSVQGAPVYEYEGNGENLKCRVGFKLRNELEVTMGEWLSLSQVQVRNSPLWKTNPKQQLGYLQVKNWARAFCPGAILGVYSADELEDAAGPGASDAPPAPKGPQRRSAAAPAPATTASTEPDPDTGEVAPPASSKTEDAPPPPARTDARGLVSQGQANYLRGKLKAANLEEAGICQRYGVDKLEALNVDAFDELKSELLALG